MAKGIKKIDWTGKGKILSDLSIPNKKAVIQADQFVYFKIAEWDNGITDEDKKRNVLWHLQTNNPRESIVKSTKKADDIYGVKLPKKLCGPFLYYLQANLPSLEYSRSANLLISGWCEPKIVSSAWATETKGEDVRKSHYFYYGHPIYLHLETEGLNGYNNLIIEVHRRVKGRTGIEDDELIKVYTQVPVINGEINIILTDTFSWNIKQKNEIEEFYITVKNPATKQYIKDYNNDVYHARYLRIQNRTELVLPKIETGTSKAKVEGESKKYEKNPGSCKFAKIGITYNDDYDLIFDEGKFIRRINPNDKFDILEKIHYDYDKWEIRNDAKPILDKVAVYLKEPPLLPVELGAHTDIRGTDEYNMELSAKRADSVVKYLISKGVPANLISAKGYGKSKLIHTGENISEELHQENRRTTLRFKLFENDAQALVHDVIVPSYKMPAKLRISIEGFSRKACHKTKEHLNKIISKDSYKEIDSHDLTEGKPNYIDVKLHSVTPNIQELINAFMDDKGQNIYSYYLNSCSYYSISNQKKPTFIINAYPDVNWVSHMRYDYPNAPFFKEIPVDLVTGIRFITQLKEKLQDYVKNISFLSGEQQEVAEQALESLTELPDSVAVGMHALHDFSNPKMPTQRIDYTEEYRWVAEVYIGMVCLAVILVELLIIYLTKGKGSFGRLRKYRKLARMSKKLNEMGFEFITPKISWSKGYYFEKQKDGRIANVSCERFIAYPIIGIQYHKVHKLVDLAENSGDNAGAKKLLDNYGLHATLKLDFEGTINADYTAKLNSLTGKFSIYEKASNILINSEGSYTAGTAIAVKGKLIVDGVVEKTITWIPFMPPQNVKIDVNLKADIGGYISFERKYGIENRNAYHQDTITFTGLKGSYVLKAQVTNNKKKVFDHNPTGKSVPIVVFGEHKIEMNKVTAFNF